jgi:soluble lytic murein transglycosylase-like protein
MCINKTDKAARRGKRGKVLATAFAAILSAASLFTVFAADASADESTVAAAINSGAGRLGRKVALPRVLSESDAAAYQKVFELQRQGNWGAADRELGKVKDDVLRGHVLAQRYLHAAYKTSYAELKEWMDDYADHPEADDVHKMALARGGKSVAGLKAPRHRPVDPVSFNMVNSEDSGNWEIPDLDAGSALSAKDRAKLKAIKQKFRQLVRSDQFDEAKAILDSGEFRRLADRIDNDQLATVFAIRQFARGDDQEVLKWALPAAERSGDQLAQANWVAGLALWRLDRPEEARRHFEAVANTRGSSWMIAAGAYWAARANLVAKRPQVVNHWLEIAAGYPRSFYGLLARRALGLSINFGWEATPLTDVDVDLLQGIPTARRGLALMQLGKRDDAEQEFQGLAGTATEALSKSLLSLANAADMPDLVVRLGSVVARQDGRYHDSAAFPVPGWKPSDGWSVDRALVLAFARQESGFNPKAKSPAGAIGLMQLMPGTARFVNGVKVAPGKLTDPAFNLSLGQAYVQHLLTSNGIGGNLFFLAAAYNSGPGSMQRWLETVKHHNDALMFIEAIPNRETRVFIEKVMTNLWIYRSRLGQPMNSMDAVCAGDWPYYDGMEKQAPAAVRPTRVRG